MLRKIIQSLRSFGIGTTCSLMNWNSDLFAPKNVDGPIEWRDHVRWWIEGKLEWWFALAWEGSDEELLAVEHDEVPVQYMSDRQLAHYVRLQIEAGKTTRLLTNGGAA